MRKPENASPAEAIFFARHEIICLTALLRALASNHISQDEVIDGGVVDYVLDKIDDAVTDIEMAEREYRKDPVAKGAKK